MKIYQTIWLILLLVLCFSITPEVTAGKALPLADSLEKVLQKSITETEKMQVTYSLAAQYYFSNMMKAEAYANKSLQLATRLNNGKIRGLSHKLLGIIALDNNQAERSITHLEHALKDMKSIGNAREQAAVIRYLGEAYASQKAFDKASSRFLTVLKMGRQLQDNKLIADAYNSMAGLHMSMNHFDSALIYDERSLEIFTTLKDSASMAVCLYNIGRTYEHKGLFSIAIDKIVRAANLLERSGRDNDLIAAYNFISLLNKQISNYKAALNYNRMAIDQAKQSQMKIALPELYGRQGHLYMILKTQEKAKAAFREGLKYAQELNDRSGSAENILGLAEIAAMSHDMQRANNYYKAALANARKADNQKKLPLCLGKFVEFKIAQKDTAGLKSMVDELALFIKDQGSVVQLGKLLGVQAAYEVLAGNPDKALQHYRQYVQMSDSFFNEEAFQKFAVVQTRYETEKKEKEIILLKQQKEIDRLNLQKRKYQLAAVLAAMAILAVISIAYLRRQQLRRRMELKLQELKTQELRRKTIAETEQAERQRIARDLHDELGSGMSKIVLSNELAKKHINGNQDLNHTLRSIDKTVQELSGNMKALIWSLNSENGTIETLLVKMREFAGDFLEESDMEPKFDFPEELPEIKLSKEMLRDIFLSFKEAVNNALKYSEASRIRLSARLEKNRLRIQVADNGIGIQPAEHLHSGSGLLNMKERIERQGGEFIVSSNPGEGTEIIFRLNIPMEP